MNPLVKKLQQIVILLMAVLFCVGCTRAPNLSTNPWEAIELPTQAALLDVAFTDDLDRGWLVGSRGTLFETTDGGTTWQPRQIDLGDEKVTFTSVSFFGQEGWIVGKPSILLHTEDGGTSWSRVPLSAKLPGSPYTVLALGQDVAEMTTDVGAIYQTTDGAKTWQALVQEAVGVIRNLSRSPDGAYIAVSSRGNFYSTWQPGDGAWVQHDRTSSRRLQNMGFGPDGQQWLLARGGQIQFTAPEAPEQWSSPIFPNKSGSWGLLEIAYRTSDELWVSGGSGNLLVSFDGGTTWQKDQAMENIPSNFYKIRFINPEKGFVLGDRGVLLRYQPESKTT